MYSGVSSDIDINAVYLCESTNISTTKLDENQILQQSQIDSTEHKETIIYINDVISIQSIQTTTSNKLSDTFGVIAEVTSKSELAKETSTPEIEMSTMVTENKEIQSNAEDTVEVKPIGRCKSEQIPGQMVINETVVPEVTVQSKVQDAVQKPSEESIPFDTSIGIGNISKTSKKRKIKKENDGKVIKKPRRDIDSNQNKAIVNSIAVGKKKTTQPNYLVMGNTSKTAASSTITSTTSSIVTSACISNVPTDETKLAMSESLENFAKKQDPTLKASILLIRDLNEQKQQHEKTSIGPVPSVFGSRSRCIKNTTPTMIKKLAKKPTSVVTKRLVKKLPKIPAKIVETWSDIPGTGNTILFIYNFFNHLNSSNLKKM